MDGRLHAIITCRRTFTALAIGILAVSVAFGILAARIARFPTTIHTGSYDVGIVLGSVVVDGAPTPVFAARIDHAIGLYERGTIRHIIFTGGNEPPRKLYDSEAARNYAAARGVPEEAMLVETRSRTTYQNLVEAKRLMDTRGWRSSAVISDPYHLYRASWQARDVGLNAAFSATPTTRYTGFASKGLFLLRETCGTIYFWLVGR